jgi:hypothetical protein
MKKIYDFNSFSRIYEAEEEKKDKPYVSLLKQILSYLNTCYMSQLKLTEDPYDSKIMGDLDLVAKTPGVDSYKKILGNVKAALDKSSPEAKEASDAWNASGEKLLASLTKLYEKLPDSKDGINKTITDFINLQKQNLANASKENKLKPEEKKNESYSFDFESLTEGLLSTKKGLFNKLSKEVTVNLALLKNSSSIPGMEEEVKKQQSKIDGIVSKISGKEVKDMEKKDLEEYLATLSTIPTEIAKKSEDLAKEDTANKEVAVLFIDAIKSIEAATEKDKVFSEKVKADEETDKNWKKSAKDAIGFKKTLKKEEIKDGKDKVLGKVQEEIIRAFKNDIKDSEVFKKFSEGKFAGDGYFGDNTQKVIKALKKGFGMDDETSDITEEFLDNVLSYRGKEGKSTNESLDFNIGRFKSFNSFETINEKKKIKFDVDAFKKALGEKSADKEKLPSVEDLRSKLEKMVSDTYGKHKEGIDYLMSKDFEPTEEGKKVFRGIFRAGWDAFKEYNETQKKNTLSMGFKTVLEPTTGIDKGIGKDVLDIYLKKEGDKK